MSDSSNNNVEILDPEQWEKLRKDSKRRFLDAPVQYCVSIPRNRLKQRYQVRYKFNKKHLLFDIFLGLLVVGLIIFNVYFFFGISPLSFINKVDLEITLDEQSVISGSDFSFSIQYSNNNKRELQNIVLGMKFPQGFKLDEVQPYSLDVVNNTITIPILEPGGSGSIDVHGFFVGDINQQQEISAFLTYDKSLKEGRTLRLSSSAQKVFSIKGSALHVRMERQPSLPYNQEIPLSFELENTSDFTFDTIIVAENFSNGIRVMSSDGIYNQEQHFWHIDSLGAHETRRVDFIVQAFNDLIEVEGDSFDKNIQVYVQQNSQRFFQTDLHYRGNYITPKLVVNTELQNTEFIQNDMLHTFRVAIENLEEKDIYDVQLEMVLPDNIFDMNQVEPIGIVMNNHIIFSSEDFPQLKLIEAQQQKYFQFSLHTLKHFNTESFDDQRKNILVELTGVVTYHLPQSEQSLVVSIIPTWLKLGTEVSVDAQGRYFSIDGEQLGRGPYPPIINEPTTYWLFLSALNTSNKVTDAYVEARLPSYVELTDLFSMHQKDALSYNKDSRQLRWNIGEIPIYTGTINKPLTINFEVRAIPQLEYEGLFLPLLENIVFHGIDTFTGDTISSKIVPITTDFSQDIRAQEKGGRVLLWQ